MNKKITIVTGTNRAGSNSLKVAKHYMEVLENKGQEVKLFDLKDLPVSMFHSDMYHSKGEELLTIVDNYMQWADTFVFVIPEYNGGFPGVLKMFIDVVPPPYLYGKKAGLIGLSSGRLGNCRGTDAFTNVLNYLKVSVYHSKPKLSGIENLLNEQGVLVEENCLKVLEEHAEGMCTF